MLLPQAAVALAGLKAQRIAALPCEVPRRGPGEDHQLADTRVDVREAGGIVQAWEPQRGRRHQGKPPRTGVWVWVDVHSHVEMCAGGQ